jgi:hypothetical protein
MITRTETINPKRSAPLIGAAPPGARARGSYPVDPLDHREQQREGDDPECDGENVHADESAALAITAASRSGGRP